MDRNNTEVDRIKSVGTFSVTTTKTYPVQFDQYMSEAPTGIKASIQPISQQMTDLSEIIVPNRSAVWGSFDMNLPIKEPVMRIGQIYRPILDMARNHDRTEYDSFFLSWSKLLVLADGETRPDRETLKTDVKKYVKRLAHKYYYYEVGVLNYLASYINMVALTRYQGAVPLKDIARNFRWSELNTMNGIIPRWYVPKGIVKMLCDLMCYAVGTTTYGADIILFPHFRTDIFASRGAQAPSWLNSFSQDSTDADHDLFGGAFGSDTNAAKAMNNFYAIYQQYGNATLGLVPNNYRIENGELIYGVDETAAQAGDLSDGNAVRTNFHGEGPEYVVPGDLHPEYQGYNSGKWDNLIDTSYASFTFWQDYLVQNFPEFMDENSDWVVFFTTQLSLLEPGPDPEIDILNRLRSNKNYVLTDLLAMKSYKAGNPPQTASWMNYSLPIHIGSGTWKEKISSRGSFTNAASFEANFERYPVDSSYPGDIIESAKLWPSNTPSTFDAPDSGPSAAHTAAGTGAYDKQPYPFVPFAIPSFGEKFAKQGGLAYSQPLIGKFASWFDRTCSSSMAPQDAMVGGIGIDSQSLEEYVKAGGGVVFEENNTKIFVEDFPIFDNTDPYQCGANIMISKQDTLSEWDYLFRSSKFFTEPQSEVPTGGAAPRYPALTYDDDQGTHVYNFHPSDKVYREKNGHTFVFVGMALLHQPFLPFALRNSGNPVTTLAYVQFGNTDHSTYFAAQCASSANYKSAIEDMGNAASAIMGGGTWAWASQMLNDFATDGAHSGRRVYFDFMFDPTMGSVPITLALNPLDEIMTTMPPHDSSSVMETLLSHPEAYNAVQLGTEGAGSYQVTLTGTEQIVDNKYVNTQSTDASYGVFKPSLREAVSGFIEKCAFRQSRYDNHRLKPTFNGVGEIHFKGISSWVLSMMSKSIAQFLGIEDLHPLWTTLANVNGLKATARIATTAAMPENNAIARPRVSNSIVKDKRSFAHTANTESHAPQRPSSITGDSAPSADRDTTPMTRKSQEDKWKRRNPKRNKDGRGKPAKVSSSGYADQTDNMLSNDTITYNKDGVESSTGYSVKGTPSAADDKDRKRRKATGVQDAVSLI